MTWFKRMRSRAALDRIAEEKLYEAAYREVDSGQRRAGLWAKALAKSAGSDEKAKSLYIEFLVQKYRDESHLQEEIMKEAFEEHLRQKRQAETESARAEASSQSGSIPRDNTTEKDKEMWEPAVSGDAVFWVVIGFIGVIIVLAIAFSQ